MFLLVLVYRELEAVLDTKTVIVSIIGKSPYHMSSYKTEVLEKFLGYKLFQSSILNEPKVDEYTQVSYIKYLCTLL